MNKKYLITVNRKSVIVLIASVLLILALSTYWYIAAKNSDQRVAGKRFQKLLGTYTLDITKTELGLYKKDTALYRNLRITFKPDSTFAISMQAPFIYDSAGTWIAGSAGLDEWNWLNYKRNPLISTQFDDCCSPDSTVLLNSVTPQEGNEPVYKLWFKRMYSGGGDRGK